MLFHMVCYRISVLVSKREKYQEIQCMSVEKSKVGTRSLE